MKMNFILPLFFVIVTLLIVISAIEVAFPFEEKWSNTIEAIAVTGALLVSGFALFYAQKEYDQHKKSEKIALLCQYLHRFANDSNIKKVEDYILDTALLDEKKDIIGFDKSKKPHYTPTIWEKEMFMHFFEEIELLIEGKMIDRNDAVDLMGYYGGVFHRIKEFHEDITDYYEEDYWKYYLKFVNNIPDDFYKNKLNNPEQS